MDTVAQRGSHSTFRYWQRCNAAQFLCRLPVANDFLHSRQMVFLLSEFEIAMDFTHKDETGGGLLQETKKVLGIV